MSAVAVSQELRAELNQLVSHHMEAMFANIEPRLITALEGGGGGKIEHDGNRSSFFANVPVEGVPEPRRGRISCLAHHEAMFDPMERLKPGRHSQRCSVVTVADDEKQIRTASRAGQPIRGESTNGVVDEDDCKYHLVQTEEVEDEEIGLRDTLKPPTFLDHLHMCTIFSLFIAALADAWEVDYEAQAMAKRPPTWFYYLDLSLCSYWTIELLIHLCVEGLSYLSIFHKYRFWHLFHLFIVVANIAEEIILSIEVFGNFDYAGPTWLKGVLRAVSLMRIGRILHLLDCLDLASELHLLMISVKGSFRSLAWALFFTFVPTLIFAMVITSQIAAYHRHLADDTPPELVHFFGNLNRSMETLFWSICGGLSWNEALLPLEHHGFYWMAKAFLLYMASTVFSVLNILTGVFVGSATKAATTEQERATIQSLKKFFQNADRDGSGKLTQHEFAFALLHSVTLKSCIESLGMRDDHALALFNLIDEDKSGNIDSEELVQGAIKFQGAVKAIDFATFMVDYNDLKSCLIQHMNLVEAKLH